jgi:hypothetical protein
LLEKKSSLDVANIIHKENLVVGFSCPTHRQIGIF